MKKRFPQRTRALTGMVILFIAFCAVLSLPHRQDSDDNLMRSKTFGWQLNGREVREVRSAAAEKDTIPGKCVEPRFLTPQGSSDVASLPKNSPER